MATRTQILNAAKGEIQSKPYTRPNKYTEWYASKYGPAFKNTAWCGIFVCYVIEKLCGDLTLLKNCDNPAYIPNIYNWAKKNSILKYTAKAGDLVIFDWSTDGKLDRDHVGFFVKDNGNGTITTIEGNTSNASDGNGNCVQQRIRDKKFVCAYVQLPYKSTTTTAASGTTKSKYTGNFPTKTLSVHTYTKAEAKLWQKFLNWALDCGLKEDGVFGTMTYKATKEFQRKTQLVIDGIAGPRTYAMAKKYER